MLIITAPGADFEQYARGSKEDLQDTRLASVAHSARNEKNFRMLVDTERDRGGPTRPVSCTPPHQPGAL